jgi:ubiquinone biosynthesis protein
VDISAKEVTQLSKTIESSVDKLVIGLILSAIVIGLSLVMMSQTFTVEFVPIIAYIIAVLVIIVIFYKMRSRGKKHDD